MYVTCSNCGMSKKSHQAVTRNCPTADFSGWEKTTYSPPGPTNGDEGTKQEKTTCKPKTVFDAIMDTEINEPPAIQPEPGVLPTKPEPVAVANDGQLFYALNTQITTMLAMHPEITIRETFSLENPKAVTLEFSRSK